MLEAGIYAADFVYVYPSGNVLSVFRPAQKRLKACLPEHVSQGLFVKIALAFVPGAYRLDSRNPLKRFGVRQIPALYMRIRNRAGDESPVPFPVGEPANLLPPLPIADTVAIHGDHQDIGCP